jgi:ABC-2 type transport system permease protein
MNTSPMITLIRREFWEYRMLWLLPLVLAGLLVLVSLLPHSGMQVDASSYHTPEKYREYYMMFHGILTAVQFALLSIILPVYLLGCLSTERRDRSILFWKSLPVSDRQTVLAKVLVALVVVPLGAFVLGAATDIVASTILSIRLHGVPMIGMFLRWDSLAWLETQQFVLAALVALLAWYAPVGAYLLVVSAWAKRSSFLWVVGPPSAAMLIEWLLFRTHYVTRFLGYRLSSARALSYPYQYTGVEPTVGGHPGMFDSARPLSAFTNVDMWLGLVAAAALVYLAIRIRRHQSED